MLEPSGPAIDERGAHVDVGLMPTVEGERGQLSQLLQNLILNAIKFTDDDVTPHVELSSRLCTDGRWEIRVADNGVGIAPDQASGSSRCSSAARRDRSRTGTGIGLALCARIVERHGGRIHVEPHDGGGSVFAFDLPGAPGAAEPGAALRGASPGRVAARAARRGPAARARPSACAARAAQSSTSAGGGVGRQVAGAQLLGRAFEARARAGPGRCSRRS